MATSLTLSPSALPRLEGERLWRRWTLWCAVGELVGFGAAGLAAVLLARFVGEPQTGAARLLTGLGMVAGGAAEGSALAAAQWQVLRGRFPALTLRAWWAPTVLAAVVGWGAGMLPSLLSVPASEGAGGAWQPALLQGGLLVAAGGALAGAMFGAFQLLALRHHARHAARWVPANALGWSVGMLWLFLGASLPGAGTPPLLVALSALGFGSLGGLSVGALTGLTLVRLPPRAPAQVGGEGRGVPVP